MTSVIVASGLVALVDDCIKTRFHQNGRAQVATPMPDANKTPLTVDMENVGPRHLMGEILHRRTGPSIRRPTSS